MSLYHFYRSRQWLGGVPAVIAVAAILVAVRTEPLKIKPVYDESAVELALVEPDPPAEVTPPAVEPAPPVIEEPPPPPVVEEPDAVLPPPKPVPPKPAPPKPVPKPAPKPAAPAVAKAAPAPVQAPSAPVAAPVAAPAKPAPAAPKVDTAALEGGYMQGIRSEMDRFKQYPTGRQASLERPTGNVVVWMLVDRAGNVLDSGIETPASSMLLNRAASTSLKRIKQVKPFPEQAFGGRSQQRFTATFNYSVQ